LVNGGADCVQGPGKWRILAKDQYGAFHVRCAVPNDNDREILLERVEEHPQCRSSVEVHRGLALT
jgi:hypothetical protein